MSEVDSKFDPAPEVAEDNETTIPATAEEPSTVEEEKAAEENTTVEQETDRLFNSGTKTTDTIFTMFGGGPKKEKKEEKEDDGGEPSGSSKAQKAEDEVGVVYFSCAHSRYPHRSCYKSISSDGLTSDFLLYRMRHPNHPRFTLSRSSNLPRRLRLRPMKRMKNRSLKCAQNCSNSTGTLGNGRNVVPVM